ncbi:SpaA isopeptide-forming pilin-related protein [Bacillus wiedmannii]|uniref:SpaA isopeptide-forming pilin-related protein n=1 Tax=Bacillus wiedmannii TaxID=1890302 RepID=UPI0024AD1306|nr:SpaA isopeptide-forming pilin-related protein [Bacillus wiedmannii]MDI6679992.1 SpaA isopeptide-forming pilin-related protein [Bacillus wiedmannii]
MKKILSLLLVFVLTLSTVPSMFVNAATPDKGSLTIHKYEQEKDGASGAEGDGSSNQTIPAGAKALPGVTFEIKQIMSFNKISNDGTIAAESVTPVTNATPIQVTTDANGQALFPDLRLGRYEVKEIAGPPHVNLNPNTYTVDVPMTSKDGAVLNYNVHIYPKNEIKRGAVELTKKGVEGKVLEGAEFSIFKADGIEVITGLVTGTDGKIRVEGLEYGDYYFQETKAPTGYVLNSTNYPFSIRESGTINANGTITSGIVVPVEITNYQEPTIDKKINNDLEFLGINPLKDYNYDIKTLIPEDIKDYKNYVVSDNVDDRLNIIGTPVVKIDGVVVDSSVVEVVVNGQQVTATVKDFSKLDGKKEFYLQIKAQIKEGVSAGTEVPNTAIIDFTNKNNVTGEKETKPVIVTPTKGSIQVTKVDSADGKTLEGAEFELRDKDGKVVVVQGQPVKGVSDANGEITWNNIPYGDYQIVETKAPTYTKDDGSEASYQLLKEPIDVTINADHQKIELSVKNNKSGWYLPSTGGMGTILFSVIGIGLMAAAAFILFRRKAVNN